MKEIVAFGVAALMLACTSAARGQPTVYDSFAYPVGALNAQSGGIGWAAPWTVAAGVATVQAGSLIPPAPADTLPTAGNSSSFSQNNPFVAVRASRTLAQPVVGTPGTTIWVGAVMKGTGEAGNVGHGSLNFSDGAGFGFGITTGATGGGPPPSTATNTWSIGDASTGFFEASTTVPAALQSLLVARATFGASTDTIDLFVNPPPGASPPATPNATLSVPHATSLTTVDVVYASLASGNSVLLDEIRMGTSFGAVTGVPEPSTLLLTGAAGLGGMLTRRRRMCRHEGG